MSTRKRIEPILVEVSLRNAIARELCKRNIPAFDDIATSVVSSLVGEPVVSPPQGVPHQFKINGVRLVWPHGLDTRVPLKEERDRFNRALSSPMPGHPQFRLSEDRITEEDNVRVLRTCYQALWRKQVILQTERAHQLSLDDVPAQVVEDAPVIKPKRTRKKVEPVVPEQDTLSGLEATLADLRKTLQV